jgi:hypothetical protein
MGFITLFHFDFFSIAQKTVFFAITHTFSKKRSVANLFFNKINYLSVDGFFNSVEATENYRKKKPAKFLQT